MATHDDVRIAVANDAAPEKSQDKGARTDISIMTWNIRDGRQGGLESAARALMSMHVNIVVVQETKISRGMYTKLSSGYTIIATDVGENMFGGVALV